MSKVRLLVGTRKGAFILTAAGTTGLGRGRAVARCTIGCARGQAREASMAVGAIAGG